VQARLLSRIRGTVLPSPVTGRRFGRESIKGGVVNVCPGWETSAGTTRRRKSSCLDPESCCIRWHNPLKGDVGDCFHRRPRNAPTNPSLAVIKHRQDEEAFRRRLASTGGKFVRFMKADEARANELPSPDRAQRAVAATQRKQIGEVSPAYILGEIPRLTNSAFLMAVFFRG